MRLTLDVRPRPLAARLTRLEWLELAFAAGLVAIVIIDVVTGDRFRWPHLALALGVASNTGRRGLVRRRPTLARACTLMTWVLLSIAMVGTVLLLSSR